MNLDEIISAALLPGASREKVATAFAVSHQAQLLFLWQSGIFLQNTLQMFKEKGATQKQKEAFTKQLTVTQKLAAKWMARQQRLVLQKISPPLGILPTDFFTEIGLKKIKIVLQRMWKDSDALKGLGIIPLIIISVATIAALWAVFQIVDEMTTTTQEREELMRTTKETAKELNLTPAQSAALLTDVQTEATKGSEGIAGIIKWALFAFLGFTAIKLVTNKN